MIKTIKSFAWPMVIALVFVLSSCADGVDEESFARDVTNSQVTSPDPSTFSITSQTNADGTESCVVEWKASSGASSYLCSVNIVDDPTNPVAMSIKGKAQEGVGPIEIDGCRIIFEKKEDTNYEISVKALGDKTLNNTDADTATIYPYTTMLTAVKIPAGQEISKFINDYIDSHYDEFRPLRDADPANYELAFELEGGQTYELNDSVGFGVFAVTFRGDKVNRPTVIVGEKGRIVTMAGTKIKWINFDCTAMKAKGLLCTDAVGDDAITTEALGLKALGGSQDCFVIMRTVLFQECYVKNLANGLVHGGDSGASINMKDFRITDCIIQQCNPEGASNCLINMWRSSGGQGGMKDMTFKNSTFLNTELGTESSYLIRFANLSNTTPYKIYGTGETGGMTIESCTFAQALAKGQLGNQYPQTGMTFTFRKNIFYETRYLQKLIRSNTANFTVDDNTIWGITFEPDNTDKEKYATLEDPMFEDPTIKALDFTKDKCGLNFKPTSAIAGGKQYGDPRWFE